MGQAVEIMSEDSALKSWAESSDTEATHAHFCPNIEPIYHNMNAAVATVTFSGKSGPISFQGNCGSANTCNSSNPLNKTVYVLCTDRNHILHNAASDTPGTRLNIFADEFAKCS